MREVLLARDLAYLSDDGYRRLNSHVSEVKRMLNSFIQSLT